MVWATGMVLLGGCGGQPAPVDQPAANAIKAWEDPNGWRQIVTPQLKPQRTLTIDGRRVCIQEFDLRNLKTRDIGSSLNYNGTILYKYEAFVFQQIIEDATQEVILPCDLHGVVPAYGHGIYVMGPETVRTYNGDQPSIDSHRGNPDTPLADV